MQPSTVALLLSCDYMGIVDQNNHISDVQAHAGCLPWNYLSKNKKSIFHVFGRNMCTVIERISVYGWWPNDYLSNPHDIYM